MSDGGVPKWPIRFLRMICPDHLIEAIEGDLLQKYFKDRRLRGRKKARWIFIVNAIRFLRPEIILQNRLSIHLTSMAMLRNYFKVTLRNITLSPLYSLINMFSLAIGLSTGLIIYLFITDELSFDTFHTKRSSIYRVYGVPHYAGSSVQKVALTPGWVGPGMVNEFHEVASYTRFWAQGKMVFKNDEDQFLINEVAAADSTFLDIFSFALQSGVRASVLDEPNSVVLTEETASKFFRHVHDAVGQALKIGDAEYKITGVLKNIPENSHLQFGALLSLSTFSRRDRMFSPTWDGSFLNTYLELKPEADKKVLESKLDDFWIRHTGVKEHDKSTTLFMQALSDIHLQSADMEHDYNNYRPFNGVYLKVFGIIGLFILIIACINFMNLTTARASHRWKEVGVRKSVGAKKKQLFGQFIFESTVLALLAFGLAILLDFFFVPFLNQVIGRELALSAFLQHPIQLLLMASIILGLGLVTGIYPAFYITSFHVTSVLKGSAKANGKSPFQNLLVVVQFALAIGMIIGTLVIAKQLSFVQHADIGFNKDQIVLIGMNREVNQKFETLRTEWQRQSRVLGVTASSQRIGNNFNGWGFKIKADTGIYHFSPSNVNVDYDYLNVYEIKIKEGRTFSRDFLTDKGKAFIVNETMARELSLKNPVGTPAGHAWDEDDSLGSIIGVAHDFNYNSLHNRIGMLALVCHPEWGYDEISIKVDGAHAEEAIALIKDVWDKNIVTYPFDYSFLDDHFDSLYRTDRQMSAVVSILSVFAVLISCMGLFGLVAITTRKKLKEIAIRKVLGASVIQITALLSTTFTKLIFLSFILASPITYYFSARWLDNFSYRIGIGPWLFLLGGLTAMVIALLTISYHAIRSARENPVNSLRYE